VEDDAVAARCIDLLRRHQKGRLTFVPLNTVRVPPVVDDARFREHVDAKFVRAWGG